MVVIFVLLTFAVFITIDYFLSKRKPVMLVTQPQPAVARGLRTAVVAGFRLRDSINYHPGHAWAMREGADMVRLGLDDFAARLVGRLEAIQLPQRGRWLRQGMKGWALKRNGAAVDMVSPMDGEVIDVNEAVLRDPELARRDPYGEGWLLKVQASDAAISFRNLLGPALARTWTEQAAASLRGTMPAAGAVAQDGGLALDSLTAQLGDNEWLKTARRFFLT